MNVKINKKKMNNILYLCSLILILISIIIRTYKKYAPKKVEEVTVTDLKEGTYNVFDNNIVLCGSVTIESNDSGILLSLDGNEITGINIIDKKYKLKPIKYDKIQMIPNKIYSETYYFYKSEGEYVLLLKGKTEDFFLLRSNKDKIKNKNFYLISVLDEKDYNGIVKYANQLEIFKACAVNIDVNRYTCYFFQ